MKKYLNVSILYAIAALIGGVFYREFTKINKYTGVTALGKVHVHLFMLGTIVFLLVSLFAMQQKLQENKTFRAFMWVYNIGLPITVIMFAIRGITEVLNMNLYSSASAAISGMAGIGHILTGTGIILLLVSLKKTADK